MKKKLNLTIAPDIRAVAETMAASRRRSLSQLFEDLIEAEWESRPPKISAIRKPQPVTVKKRRRGRTT
ncbi:MAG: DUF6364 family protein [Terrimicrobiaceae bacterium]